MSFIISLSFQDIIPISLYLSIEFVRTCQAAFIFSDYQITYEKTNQATLARSWNLSDDLGQIEYIFSDKTGTLTQVRTLFIMVWLKLKNKKYRISWSSGNALLTKRYTRKVPEILPLNLARRKVTRRA